MKWCRVMLKPRQFSEQFFRTPKLAPSTPVQAFPGAQVAPEHACAAIPSAQVAAEHACAAFPGAQVAPEHACAAFYRVFTCFLEPSGSGSKAPRRPNPPNRL